MDLWSSAHETWSLLEHVHDAHDAARGHLLLDKWLSLRMKEGDKILSHVTALRTLASELSDVGLEQFNIVANLYRSLPDSYATLVVTRLISLGVEAWLDDEVGSCTGSCVSRSE